MSTIFKNSENNETSEPYSLVFNLADKRDLRRCGKHAALLDLIVTTILVIWKY